MVLYMYRKKLLDNSKKKYTKEKERGKQDGK